MSNLIAHTQTHNKCIHHKILNQYLSYYKSYKQRRPLLKNQLKNVMNGSMKFIINTPFHEDEFNSHLYDNFVIEDVKSDGNCGFNAIIKCLRNLDIVTDNFDWVTLRKTMFDKMNEKEFLNLFTLSKPDLNDLDEQCLSQKASMELEIEEIKRSLWSDDLHKRFLNYKHVKKEYWLDSNIGVIILSLIYQKVSFHCFVESTKDMYMFKFNKEQNKTLISHNHIYLPFDKSCCVCILHQNNHYKALIPKPNLNDRKMVR